MERKDQQDGLAIYEDSCFQYLTKNCSNELQNILSAENDKDFYPIFVSYILLFEDFPLLGDAILKKPLEALIGCDRGALRALIHKYEEMKGSGGNFSLKQKVHVRIHSLPVFPETHRQGFPGTKDIGSFMCILGTVIRISCPKILEYSRLYQCSKCEQSFDFEAAFEKYHSFPKKLNKCPKLCANAKVFQVEKSTKSSGELSFSKYRDYQEIKIQEHIQQLDFGSLPKSLVVILEDDLVDQCKPGDSVAICGTIMTRWKSYRANQRAESELCLKANYIQVINDQRSSVTITEETEQFVKLFWQQHSDDPFVGRNHILSSFCPQVYGMYVVKLAMCVILASGVGKEKNGNRVRGESHLLLVGDPGIGKSQLLKYVSKICPRSVITTGIGTTKAGLTVSAVKDGGEWELEAGALVLADGGICCIDEFLCIKEQDLASVHEVMEQQTISIAKAGMVCKISTRCSIIAATNPKGKFDPNDSSPVNVSLASPLLSRFDVILVLQDAQNETWDNLVTDFILQGKDPQAFHVDAPELWGTDRLQSYIVIIKELQPVMSSEANDVLSNYYQLQRRSTQRNAARTTIRLLESLVRLAEGHARLMYREKVILHDAISAIALIDLSMQDSSLFTKVNILHTAFPTNPMLEYENQAQMILEKLGLVHLWESERMYLDSLKRHLKNPTDNPNK